MTDGREERAFEPIARDACLSLLEEILGQPVTGAATLGGLHMDSLSMIEWLYLVEQDCGYTVDDAVLLELNPEWTVERVIENFALPMTPRRNA